MPLMQLILSSLLAGLGALLFSGQAALVPVAVAGLCCVVLIAGTRLKHDRAAVLWAALATVVYVGARLASWPGDALGAGDLGGQRLAGAALELGGVPVVLGLLAWQVQRLSRSRAKALTASEVARAKLVRSNARLEAAIAETEAALTKLGTVVDNLGEGLLAVSAAGRVEIVNPALGTLLQVDELAVGAGYEATLPEAMQTLVATCLGEGRGNAAEFRHGEQVLQAVGSPVVLQGALWGAVVLARDVTLQHDIDRMKSNFTATVSHEMRTPLTSVLGFTQLIRSQLDKHVFPHVPADARRAQKAADTVRSNLDIVALEGRRLTELINDVLDLSKIESGQMVWQVGSHGPEELVERALAATQMLFADKPTLTVVRAVTPDLPDVVVDRDRVLQVLINLLSNAVKFTDTGTVTVAAVAEADQVRFEVRDQGVGIAPADQARVFDRFQQVGDTLTNRPKGTGLGLPICREIVAHHGGRLWVESALGQGSCFAFTLPTASAERTTGPKLPAELLTRLRSTGEG